MVEPSAPDASEILPRRATAIESAVRPVALFLADLKVVEILLNADGRIWVDRLGGGMAGTDARMGSAGAERMLRVIASEMGVELNAAAPLLVSNSRGPTARLDCHQGRGPAQQTRATVRHTLMPTAETLCPSQERGVVSEPSHDSAPST